MHDKSMEVDGNELLVDLITDYVEDNLNYPEKVALENYMDKYPEVREYVRKVWLGRRALTMFAPEITASEGFEARLALRLALENCPG